MFSCAHQPRIISCLLLAAFRPGGQARPLAWMQPWFTLKGCVQHDTLHGSRTRTTPIPSPPEATIITPTDQWFYEMVAGRQAGRQVAGMRETAPNGATPTLTGASGIGLNLITGARFRTHRRRQMDGEPDGALVHQLKAVRVSGPTMGLPNGPGGLSSPATTRQQRAACRRCDPTLRSPTCPGTARTTI